MEYLIGVIAGIAVFALAILIVRKEAGNMVKAMPLKQSFIISLVDAVSSMYEDEEEYDDEDEEDGTKVVFANNRAYWLDEGKFFVAETDGESVLVYTKQEVDTMSMNHVELNHLMKIVEALRSNDEDRS